MDEEDIRFQMGMLKAWITEGNERLSRLESMLYRVETVTKRAPWWAAIITAAAITLIQTELPWIIGKVLHGTMDAEASSSAFCLTP